MFWLYHLAGPVPSRNKEAGPEAALAEATLAPIAIIS
jgi:hypothetical protein